MSHQRNYPSPPRRGKAARRALLCGAGGAALVLAAASAASAHTATATAMSSCLNGQSVSYAQWVNDWTDPATVTAGTLTLTLPASGSVTANVPVGKLAYTVVWTDGYQEDGNVVATGRTDCAPKEFDRPFPTPTTTIPVEVPTEIITAVTINRPPEVQAAAVTGELARTGVNPERVGVFLLGGIVTLLVGLGLTRWADRGDQ